MKFIVDKYKIIFKREKYKMLPNYTHKGIGSKLAISIPQRNFGLIVDSFLNVSLVLNNNLKNKLIVEIIRKTINKEQDERLHSPIV